VLVLALQVSTSDAMLNLERAAVRHHTHVEILAEAVVGTASSGKMPQSAAIHDVLSTEWGDFLR
jgi:hypothetical protein